MSTTATTATTATEEKTTEPAYKNFPLETREIQTKEETYSFNFLVIDRADKWEAADSFRHSTSLKAKGRKAALRINLRSLSYGEWEECEATFPQPPLPQNIDSLTEEAKQTYKDQQDAVVTSRQIRAMELSTGKEVPGSDMAEKIQYLEQLGIGESRALIDRIVDYYSAVDEGDELRLYKAVTAKEKTNDEILFESFDDWLNLSDNGMSFHWQRPWEEFLIEFPFKKLTQEQYDEIIKANQGPQPPERPGRNPVTNKVDPKFPIRNLSDKKWMKANREANRRRLVALLEALLPFPIPGSNEQEKSQWLGQRLLGDVIAIDTFLSVELSNYRSRFDFFIGS